MSINCKFTVNLKHKKWIQKNNNKYILMTCKLQVQMFTKNIVNIYTKKMK